MIGIVPVVLLCSFNQVTLEGWNIRLEQGVVEDSSWPAAKAELTRQLQNIKRIVPEQPLVNLQKVTIWVNSESKVTQCMAYHPGREWLKEHGANPDMAKGVEMGSCKLFASWTRQQPWMVMHELAHAYHDQFLEKGFENPGVLEVFKKSMGTKKYDSVLHWNGKNTKHYATSNQMEFFAETAESYFGTNDFFPFVKAELINFDPEALGLMKNIWGEPGERTLTANR
jgi:hypothetical protein